MFSVFDFDQTITINHTFEKNALNPGESVVDQYQRGKEHAASNVKAGILDHFKHDDENFSAIATWHNNPDYIAGYVAKLFNKELKLVKSTTFEPSKIAINEYVVEGMDKSFYISYINAQGIDFIEEITKLQNKNPQLLVLRKTLILAKILQEDTVIDFYEDTKTNFDGAQKLAFVRCKLVDRTSTFNVIEEIVPNVDPIKPIFSVPPTVKSISTNISMQVLGGFIAVLGIAAIAVAFTALNASTFGSAGLLLATVGAAALLGGVGLFKNARQSNDIELVPPVNKLN